MNRKYSITEFERKINKIIQILPDLALTTDIIAGFPTETKKNHKETYDFIKRTLFARLHIFGYSDRYGTKASALNNKVGINEIKTRTKKLLEIDCEKRKNFLKKYIGTKRKAVKIGKDKALTDNYITVKTQQLENNITPEEHNFNLSVSYSSLLLNRGIFEVEVTETSQI
jgi:threonylcarbamoyladenosine tRNA methylthiotransferase MtaB